MRSWFETVKSVLIQPDKFFSKMKAKGGYSQPLQFASINFIIFGLFTGLMTLNVLGLVGGVITGLAGGIIGLFVGGFIYHIIILLLGGKGDYEGSFRVMSYVSAIYTVAWIPIIGFVVSIYSIYLYTLGFAKIHKISKGKALVGVLIPLIIALVILSIFASLFTAAVLGGLFGYGLGGY